MSEFEFSRTLASGAHLPLRSPVRQLDPRARLILAITWMAALAAVNRPVGLLVGLGLVLVFWGLAQASLLPLLKSWLRVLPFLLILALIQILFTRGGTPLRQIGPIEVTSAGIWAGATLVLRFSTFIAMISLAAASLSSSEVTRSLESLLRPLSLLRIPTQDFVMVVQVTLRFFPLMAQTAERIAKAQAARGANWSPAGWNPVQRARQVAPLIVPLFVTSLRRSENVALAMDARAYGSLPRRTSMFTMRFGLLDYGVLVIGVGLAVLLFFL